MELWTQARPFPLTADLYAIVRPDYDGERVLLNISGSAHPSVLSATRILWVSSCW